MIKKENINHIVFDSTIIYFAVELILGQKTKTIHFHSKRFLKKVVKKGLKSCDFKPFFMKSWWR